MIADSKLKLILELYKKEKITFEEAKELLKEVEKPYIPPYDLSKGWDGMTPTIMFRTTNIL